MHENSDERKKKLVVLFDTSVLIESNKFRLFADARAAGQEGKSGKLEEMMLRWQYYKAEPAECDPRELEADHFAAHFLLPKNATADPDEVAAFEAANGLSAPRRIEVAPGFKLHGFLTSICPKEFSERVLDALLADSIELYFEKLNAGDIWGARRVRWAMRGWMLWAVFGGAITGAFSLFKREKKSSD